MKSKNVTDINVIPDTILSAAWGPQRERMEAGIYFSLFLVLINVKSKKDFSIYYLSADLQPVEIFVPRKALSETAKRAGWQGYYFDFKKIKDRFARLV